MLFTKSAGSRGVDLVYPFVTLPMNLPTIVDHN